jgi:phosphoglycerate kinase
VAFASDTVGESARETVAGLNDGEVAVLENVRFEPGETSKDDAERLAVAERLADLADVFVSDGFGVVHRKQASVYDVARLLPHAAGGLVLAEVEVLRRLTVEPERPYVVVLGGSKVSDKLGVIASLLERADSLVIGGGMVFTFLAAQGTRSARRCSRTTRSRPYARISTPARQRGVRIVLPTDIVVAPEVSASAPASVVSVDAMPADQAGLDIGPDSAEQFAEEIRAARTVFWNGPMGVFELEAFAAGTRTVAQALTEQDGLSVVGGGDSAAAVRTLGFRDEQFGHISTGGGASLEYLEGRRLPGLDVLTEGLS